MIDVRDDVVTVDEVARRLEIPKKTSTTGATRFGPRSHRIGKHPRYRWSDVIGWLDA